MRLWLTIIVCVVGAMLSTSCPGPPGPRTFKTQIIMTAPNDPRKTFPASIMKVTLKTSTQTYEVYTDLDGNVSYTFASDPGTVTFQLHFDNDSFSFTNTDKCADPPLTFQEQMTTAPPAVMYIPIFDYNIVRTWEYLTQVNSVAVADLGTPMFKVAGCI